MEKPPSVPVEAVWSARDGEWVLAPKDAEERMHGLVTYWRPDGSLVNHCHYEHGVPHGGYKRYHQSGEVSREGTFQNGQIHGTDVFHRTGTPTTEHFPQGLSEGVWRAEMDTVHGHVVAGRCYDKDGKRVTDGGEPFPSRPASVPETASYSSQTGRWLDGPTNAKHERHGLFCFWDRDGALTELTDFVDGEERRTEHFEGPLEGQVAVLLREGRFDDAAALARQRGLRTDDDLPLGRWLLRALDAMDPGATRDERVRVATAMIALAPTPGWGVFTASGRKRFEARQLALDTLAKDALGRGAELEKALAWAEEAIDCDHHYGNDGPRVTAALVLERLGRKDEAFAMARRVLAGNPEAEGLERFRSELAGWLKTLSTEEMTLEGAREVLGCGGERLGELVGPIVAGEAEEEAESETAHASPALAASLRDAALGAYEHEHEHEDEEEEEDALGERDLRGVLGEELSPELRAYCDLIARVELRGTYRGVFSPPEVLSVGEALRMEDGNWLARFRSIFCAMSPILAEDEEMYFPTWWADAQGQSRVYYAHQDEWELAKHAGSIASFFVGRMLDEHAFQPPPVLAAAHAERLRKAASLIDAEPVTIPAELDPEKLQARVDWLIDVFMGIQGGGGDPFASAPGTDVWRGEREHVAAWPHLQAYWLLAHAILDNREHLAEVLAMTEESQYPAVLELRAVARAILEGQPVAVPFWDEPRIRGARETALRGGHRHLFDPAALARLEGESAAFLDTDRAAAEALDALRAAGETDAIELWDVLQSAGGAIPSFEQQCARAWFKKDEEQQMRLFTAQKRGHAPAVTHMVRAFLKNLDAAWAPVFRARLLRGAAFESEHQANAPGALAGLGASLGSYAAFMKELEAFSFYPERHDRLRRLEHALVAERYWDEGEAPKAFLRAEAKRWAGQIDAWSVDTSNAAINILFEKHDAEGLRLANELLQTATFSGANWNACVGLCIACGKQHLTAATEGLRKAVEKGLGRHDDADRGRVIRAYALAAGKSAVPTLEAWLANVSDVRKSCEQASLLGALLLVDGENPRRAEAALSLVDEMLEGSLGSMELGALHALAAGLVDAKVPGAKPRFARVLERGKADKWTKKSVLKELEGFLEKLT